MERCPSSSPLEEAVDCNEVTAQHCDHPSVFSHLIWTNKVTSASPHKSFPQGLSPSWSPSPGHTLIVWCLSHTVAPKTTHSSQGEATPMRSRAEKPPPSSTQDMVGPFGCPVWFSSGCCATTDQAIFKLKLFSCQGALEQKQGRKQKMHHWRVVPASSNAKATAHECNFPSGIYF